MTYDDEYNELLVGPDEAIIPYTLAYHATEQEVVKEGAYIISCRPLCVRGK